MGTQRNDNLRKYRGGVYVTVGYNRNGVSLQVKSIDNRNLEKTK